MKQVLKYPGSKTRLASWICEYIPHHNVYVEPYMGSLAVLFNKPRCHIETVNDINGDVVNYFMVIRDHPEELRRLIENTPYARDEYEKSYENTEDPIEKARRYCVRCWQGFGCSNRYKNGWKSGQQTRSPNPAKAWSALSNTMAIAHERLQGVQIENLPALEILSRYDTQDVFIYLDPPYLRSTRKGYLYVDEMTDADHFLLLETITQHPGRILISGYDNDLYTFYLSGERWRKVQKQSQVEQGLKRMETLWMNYDPPNRGGWEMVKEAQIEKWLNEQVKELGGLSYKFVSPPDNPGVPDRIYIFPSGEVWFVELKTQIGYMSNIQKWQRERISGMGCNFRLIKGMTQAREFIAERKLHNKEAKEN